MYKRFKVVSFPTFIFLIDGIPFEFTGQRGIDSLLEWMHQLVDAPAPTELKSLQEINEFISEFDLSVVYFGSGTIFTDKNFWTFY
jgi:thioredoxin-like negative regulator of GroEL